MLRQPIVVSLWLVAELLLCPGTNLAETSSCRAPQTILSFAERHHAFAQLAHTIHSDHPLAGSSVVARSWPVPDGANAAPAHQIPDDIFEGASIGTAWPLVSGYVVTNNHVISGCRQVVLITPTGQSFTAWPVLRDEITDIAMLEVATPDTLPPALPLSNARTKLGSSVFTIGFPRIDLMGKAPKLANGIISCENGLRDDPCKYQTTVPIQPGNSGGPVLNMSGEVVGVVASMLGIRDPASGAISPLAHLSCVIKIACIKALFPHLPSSSPKIKSLTSRPGDLATVADRVQGSVLIVVAR